MIIQVLGSGCPTCEKLFKLAKQAVEELKLETEVEYVTDVREIVAMGLMQSPVLAVDGKPALVGFVPDVKGVKEAIIKSIA